MVKVLSILRRRSGSARESPVRQKMAVLWRPADLYEVVHAADVCIYSGLSRNVGMMSMNYRGYLLQTYLYTTATRHSLENVHAGLPTPSYLMLGKTSHIWLGTSYHHGSKQVSGMA